MYDKEFRMHLGAFPDRSWAIILQQTWSMYLKDRVNFNNNQNRSWNRSAKGGKKEVCRRYNKGLCTSRRNCNYEHKCLECGKFGHGAHICHKKSQNANNSTSSQAAGTKEVAKDL